MRTALLAMLAGGAAGAFYCADDTHFREVFPPGYMISSYMVYSGGYNLKLFRVNRLDSPPSGNVALFLHGVFDSADCFVVDNSASVPLGLLEKDYDVFFVNFRGNKFSCTNDNFSPDQEPFWNFSFQEMAEEDLPNAVDFVLRVTRATQLDLVAHSQGTTAAFAYLAKSADHRRKVKKFVAIAPVVFLNNFKTQPSYYYWVSTHDFITKLRYVGIYYLFSQSFNFDWATDKLMRWFCQAFPSICGWVLDKIANKRADQVDWNKLSDYLQHFPSRSSVRSLEHYLQLIRDDSEELLMYDFGPAQNRAVYGQDKPPAYDLSVIDTPVFLYYGDEDLFAISDNVQQLKATLQRAELRFYPHWGHIEWFVGKENRRFVDQALHDIMG